MRRRRTGAAEFRSKPQLILANHLWALTSLAPLWLPNLVNSSLANSLVTISLHSLIVARHDQTSVL